MIALAAIFYIEEQNEPSLPELIRLDISTDNQEAVHAEVLRYLRENSGESSNWAMSESSFFGENCWQFDNLDDDMHCFVSKDYVSN